MGQMVVSHSAYLRDESGQFLSAVDRGATRAVTEMALRMEKGALYDVPRKTGRLAKSIQMFVRGHESGIIADAPYAAVQEKGGAPHVIGTAKGALANPNDSHGNNFFVPNPLYPGGTVSVNHPGNPATHFISKAGRAVSAQGVAILRKHMPG